MSTRFLKPGVLFLSALAALISNAEEPEAPSYDLDELVVVSSRTIEKANGYVTNLSGSELTKGKSTTEVLRSLPHINAESNSIRINGLEASEVYIDEIRITDLSQLETLSAEMIEKVEVEYLSGADKDSSTPGGTLRIILKKPKDAGAMGTLNGGATLFIPQGLGSEHLSGMVKGNVNRFSFYEGFYLNRLDYEEKQQFSYATPTRTFNKETLNRTGFLNQISLSQGIGEKVRVGAVWQISLTDDDPLSESLTEGNTDIIRSHNRTLQNQAVLSVNARLSDKGATLSLKGEWLGRHHTSSQIYAGADKSAAEYDVNNRNDQYLGRIDLTLPVSDNHEVTAGASALWIDSKERPNLLHSSLETLMLSEICANATGLTPLVYVTSRGTFSRLSYDVGLNWQLNRISYTYLNSGTTNRNTQWSVNPSLQLLIPLGKRKEHNISVAYKHILDKIPYSAISSATTWTDYNNCTVGNPDLKAPTEHLVSVGSSLFDNMLSLNAMYMHDRNSIYWKVTHRGNDNEINIFQPVNLHPVNQWMLNAEWRMRAASFCDFKLMVNYMWSPENLTIDGTHFNGPGFRQYYVFNSNFRWCNTWGASLMAYLEPTYSYL